MVTSDEKMCLAAKFVGFRQCAVAFFCTEVVYRPRSPLHFDIENMWQTRTETWNYMPYQPLLPADMLERWPHVWRVKITFTFLPTNWFVSTETKSMKCLVNWIPMEICVRSRNTQPRLNPMINNLRSVIFLAALIAKIWKCDNSSTSKKAFVWEFWHFCCCWSTLKKRWVGTQQFTHSL